MKLRDITLLNNRGSIYSQVWLNNHHDTKIYVLKKVEKERIPVRHRVPQIGNKNINIITCCFKLNYENENNPTHQLPLNESENWLCFVFIMRWLYDFWTRAGWVQKQALGVRLQFWVYHLLVWPGHILQLHIGPWVKCDSPVVPSMKFLPSVKITWI